MCSVLPEAFPDRTEFVLPSVKVMIVAWAGMAETRAATEATARLRPREDDGSEATGTWVTVARQVAESRETRVGDGGISQTSNRKRG